MLGREEVQTASHNLIVMSLLLAACFDPCGKPSSGSCKIHEGRQFNFNTL